MASFIGTASTVPGTTGATAVTLPTWAAGDLVLVFVGWKYFAGSATISAGWTDVTGAVQNSGVTTTGTDAGGTGGQVFARVMQAGDTAPTVTPSGINSQAYVAESWRPDSGNTWADAANLAGIPFASATDDSLASPLTGSGTFSTQPDAAGGAQLTGFGCIPTDVGTGVSSASTANSGISGATDTVRQYAENTLGADLAVGSWTTTGWTGTGTGASTLTMTTDAGARQNGVLIALWLRESAAGTNAPAEQPSGTGAANAATAAVGANAEQPIGTGVAQVATPSLGVQSQATGGTGQAFDATVTTAGGTSAAAETTTGTGSAPDAAAAVTVNAGQPGGTGTAQAATAALTGPADETTGVGAAPDALAALAVNAGQPVGTGSAFDATVSTAAQTNAPAELTSGTGTASDATAALAVNAGTSTGSGQAFNATVTIGVNALAGLASATGASLGAVAAIAVQVEAALATGQAFDAETPPESTPGQMYPAEAASATLTPVTPAGPRMDPSAASGPQMTRRESAGSTMVGA